VTLDMSAATPIKMWFDGVQSSTTGTQPVGTVPDNAFDVRIGQRNGGEFFDGKLYQFAFFSGYAPSISEVYDSVRGQPKDVANITGLHSLLYPDSSVTADYVRGTAWTNNNTVVTSTDYPTNYGQELLVSAYTPATRTLTHDTCRFATTSVPFRLDMSGAISVAINDLTYEGRYLGVTISDGDNGAGYIEAGYLTAGDYLQPDYDVNFGYSIGFQDGSQIYVTESQSMRVNIKNKFRTLQNATFSFLSEDEARGAMFNVLATTGTSKPIVFLPFYENSFRTYTDSIFGYVMEPPRITQVRTAYNGRSYETTFGIRENI